MQNGIAIAGDYLSAASFLGIAGAIAVYGYDGFLYSIGPLVAWLVAQLLVAELLRNTGRFTMADVLSFRLEQRPVPMVSGAKTPMITGVDFAWFPLAIQGSCRSRWRSRSAPSARCRRRIAAIARWTRRWKFGR